MRLSGGYDSHPAADAFPMLEGPRKDALLASIRTRGLDPGMEIVRLVVRERPEPTKKDPKPRAVDRKYILDGRNRLEACLAAGIKPRFVEYRLNDDGITADGIGDVFDFVASRNLHRRDLNESARAMAAERLATLRQGAKLATAKAKPDPKTGSAAGLPVKTQAAAAALLDVSERLVRDARAVRENAVPELVRAAELGRLPVTTARRLAKESPELQRRVAKRVDIDSGKDIRPGLVSTILKQEKRKAQAADIASEPTPLPTGPFRVFVADFPWRYETRESDPTQRGQTDYSTMTIEEGCRLGEQIRPLIHPDGAVLWFWITGPFLLEGAHLPLLKAWGDWRPRKLITWDKVNPAPGNTLFSRLEYLILATVGDPPLTISNEHDLIVEKKREHSRKPELSYELFERVSKGSKIELFNRTPRPGYAAWGAEVGRFAPDAQTRLRG